MKLLTNPYRVLVIPDLQIPFHHPDAFQFLGQVYQTYKCDRVVSIGDEVDQYNLSRFPKDPDGPSAGEEYAEAMKHLKTLYDYFPKVDAVYSNHLDRISKKALDAGIPRVYLKSLKEWMGAPSGWNWDDAVVIGGVRYEHGDACGGRSAARILAESNRRSTVIGHHHSHAGIEYISNADEMIFGMNVGALVNQEAIAFKYAKKARYKTTLGCGVVIEGVPQVVPMVINSRGRWNGKVYK